MNFAVRIFGFMNSRISRLQVLLKSIWKKINIFLKFLKTSVAKKYNSVTNENTDLGVGYVYHFTQKTVHRDQLFLLHHKNKVEIMLSLLCFVFSKKWGISKCPLVEDEVCLNI